MGLSGSILVREVTIEWIRVIHCNRGFGGILTNSPTTLPFEGAWSIAHSGVLDGTLGVNRQLGFRGNSGLERQGISSTDLPVVVWGTIPARRPSLRGFRNSEVV